MSTQPKALRLAELLESDQQGIDLGAEGMGWGPSATVRTQAAAELRRLYSEVDSLSYRLAYPGNFTCEKCDELLAALKEVLNCDKTRTSFGAVMRARAAIAKAEGGDL
jgi:hypothetical protein